MSLKITIQTDFVQAMKDKDVTKKSALSSLKAKITEAEKNKGNTELSDDDVIKVISSAIKQRNQSYVEFTKGGREDLATKEQNEIVVLEGYLPAQMNTDEIKTEVLSIISTIDPSNKQRLIGQTIGAFNKKFTGRVDNVILKNIVEELASEIV